MPKTRQRVATTKAATDMRPYGTLSASRHRNVRRYFPPPAPGCKSRRFWSSARFRAHAHLNDRVAVARQQTVKFVCDAPVTIAGRGFQAFAVQDGDIAARIADE